MVVFGGIINTLLRNTHTGPMSFKIHKFVNHKYLNYSTATPSLASYIFTVTKRI